MRFLTVALVIAAAGVARAQQPVAPAPEATAAPAPRPTLALAIGYGFARDDSQGATVAATATPPVFLADGELIGRSGVGFLARVGTVAGEGDFNLKYDRLAIAAALEWRPLARPGEGELRWGERVVRRIALEVGLGMDHLNGGAHAAQRYGLHLGMHVDLPLSGGADTGLFVRAAIGRRVGLLGDDQLCRQTRVEQGRTECVSTIPIDDTVLEGYLLLGAAF